MFGSLLRLILSRRIYVIVGGEIIGIVFYDVSIRGSTCVDKV